MAPSRKKKGGAGGKRPKPKKAFRLPVVEITPARFALALALILAAGWLLRLNDLGADPPGSLSWSQGPFTDGAVVLHDARNKVLHDDWIRDYCEDMFLFPLSNFFAWPFLEAFGVGRLQAALPNTLLGVGAILFFTLAVAKRGRGWALLWALFASLNYYLIQFQRIPVAEPAMVLLMACGFLFYARSDGRAVFLVLAGFFAAAAPLFGKAHAFYFPVVMLAAIALSARERRARFREMRLAATGMAAAVAIWALLLFLPHGDYILAHVTYESVNKHVGGPAGFVREFVQNLFAMGSYTNVFELMPVLTALGLLGLFGALRRGRKLLAVEDRIGVFLLLWLCIGWVTLAAVRLPAPRYLIAVAFPLIFFALRPFAALLEGKSLSWDCPRRAPAILAGIFALAFVLYQPSISTGMKQVQFLNARAWGKGIHDFFIHDNAYAELVVFCAAETLIVLAVVVAVIFVLRPKRIRLSLSPASGAILAIILFAGSLFFNLGNYWYWTRFNTHYLRDASRDLAEWIGPDARLMGSFAPALGIDNTLDVFPYFGGLGDEDVLHKYGITHVVISSKGDFDYLKNHYPEAHARKEKVLAYPVKSRYTSVMAIYRLPRELGGRVVNDYEPTVFERAVRTAADGDWEGALALLREFLRLHPEHADAHYMVGFMYNQLGDSERAAQSFRRAIELRGERPRYYEELARVYRSQGRSREAMELLEHAYQLNPRDKLVQEQIMKMGGQFE